MNKGEGTYNVVVIGAGTAGLVTAAGTAGLGGRVALVERGKMGGDCLNTGCVPSKALISSARLVEQIRQAEDWGLRRQEPQFQFEAILARMRERRAKIAPHDSQYRFESLGVDVFRGHARFLSPKEVQVGDLVLKARNFVIATGTRPAIPAVDGLDRAAYYTNETVFDELREKPQRMVVLGGGPIGCELGQTFDPDRGHPHAKCTLGVVPIAFKRWILSQHEQRIGEPVDASDSCERVIDRRAKRADRYFDDLGDSELGVLCQRTMPPYINVPVDCGLHYARRLLRHH